MIKKRADPAKLSESSVRNDRRLPGNLGTILTGSLMTCGANPGFCSCSAISREQKKIAWQFQLLFLEYSISSREEGVPSISRSVGVVDPLRHASERHNYRCGLWFPARYM